MKIVCSPQGIVDHKRPGQGIIDIANADYHNVVLDFSQFCSPEELESAGKKHPLKQKKSVSASADASSLLALVQPMLDKMKSMRLHAAAAYAPYLNWNTKRTDLTEFLTEVTEKSIQACGNCGCKYIMIRPLYAGVERGKEWEANRRYYLHLAPLARENNVTILLENQCMDVNGHLVRGICSDGREAAEWVDMLNAEAGEERFGFCMDVGVCSLCGQNMYEFVRGIGNRMKAVILRDCDGNRENALLPFTCANKGRSQTDWLNLLRGLRQIDFDGQLIMNFADTAASFSPILRPHLMRLAKATADYFKWQIEIESLLKQYPKRVLFGAGNMCRAYMKCYGEQYPPLFTCDNNRNLWGTQFCGLEVKSPGSLKELPADCAIFICNIYYREIEEQLRGVGLENPIEFFNDEYLPMFHFNRLEDR